MLKLFRVDDNLLHGQVALSWLRNLHIHIIMVVNDDAFDDEFVKMTLGLSKPKGVELVILKVRDAISYIQNQKKMNLLIITKTMQDALVLIEHGIQVQDLNLGRLRRNQKSVFHYKNLYMTQNDIDCCQKMKTIYHVNVIYQPRFSDEKILMDTLLQSESNLLSL